MKGYETKMTACKCRRCGYEWIHRRDRGMPKTCANARCRTPYWMRERKRKIRMMNKG